MDNKPLSISELVFYLSFAVFFGFRAFGGVDGGAYYTPMILGACFLFLIRVLMTRHTAGELLVICVLYLCAGITYVVTGEKALLIDYAMMLGMKGISEKRLFTFAAWILGPAMFIVIMPYALGILEDPVAPLMGGRRPWMAHRYCLGYPHTNTLLTTYIILMILVLFATGFGSLKKVLVRSGILALGAFYLWLWCDSRTGALITVLYLAMNLYYGFGARFKLPDKLFIYGLYPLINIVAIGGTLLYSDHIYEQAPSSLQPVLQSLFERFRLTQMYLDVNPISPFGVRIIIPEGEEYAIDVSQMRLLLNLGIIAFVAVSILYCILLVDCVRNKRREQLPVILCLMIMGISDPLLYNLSCKNLTFPLMGAALFRLFAAAPAGSSAGEEPAGSRHGSLAGILRRKVLLLPLGERELPRLSSAIARFDACVKNTFVFDSRRLLLSLLLSLIVAVVYHLCTAASIAPIENNALAGMYFHALCVLSAGIYAFLIGYGGMCMLGRREQSGE